MRWLARARRWQARRPWLRWTAVMVAASTVGLTVAHGLRDLDDRRSAWGVRASVLVAGRTLAPGEPVTAADLVAAERPLALLPDGPLVREGDLRPGARTWQWIAAGEVVMVHDLTGVSSSAMQLPPRTRGVVVPGGGLPVRPGDGVDLTVDGVTVTGATVIEALTPTSGRHGDALLVAVPEAQAAPVAWAVADGRVAVMLAVRPPAISASRQPSPPRSPMPPPPGRSRTG